MKFGLVALAVLAGALALFFASDADLGLWLRSDAPKRAFAGQVVWIVGASSGIGASLALDFAKSGAHGVLSARRVQQLEELAQQCTAVGPEALVVPLDVTDSAKHEEAYAAVMKRFGHVDVLVLNAGRSQRNLAVETPIETTREIMDLNFFSLIELNRRVLPSMIARKSGQIVVMSSVSGLLGTPIASSYSASKFALHGYFNSLRAELSVHNVSVTVVCPGPVESEIASKAHVNPNFPRQVEGEKMPTARCSQLVLRGLFHRLGELWIAQQPILLVTYLTVYLPGLNRQIMTRVMGPARIKALEGGKNIYDLKTILGLASS